MFVLNGELHILHVSVMVFQFVADIHKLSEHFGHGVLKLCNGLRRTHACHHVFALSINQKFAHQLLFSGCRVTGEGNACPGGFAHVSKGHHLNVYRGSPGIRDVVVAAVHIGAGVIPGTEHGFDCAKELCFRVSREVLSDFFLIFSLKLVRQFFQILCGQLYVLCHAFIGFHFVNQFFKVFLSHFHNNIRIHLDKSAVAVPGPARIAGFCGKDFNHVLVKSQVQNGIHHTRHGSSRS